MKLNSNEVWMPQDGGFVLDINTGNVSRPDPEVTGYRDPDRLRIKGEIDKIMQRYPKNRQSPTPNK